MVNRCANFVYTFSAQVHVFNHISEGASRTHTAYLSFCCMLSFCTSRSGIRLRCLFLKMMYISKDQQQRHDGKSSDDIQGPVIPEGFG